MEHDPEANAPRPQRKESPELSIGLRVRRGEGMRSIAPLRKWRLPLEALRLPLEAERLPSGWIGADSRMISAMRYRLEEVAFHKGVYLYYGAPLEILEGLLRARSEGRYHACACHRSISVDQKEPPAGPPADRRLPEVQGNPIHVKRSRSGAKAPHQPG